MPGYLPDAPPVRGDLAEFYGAIAVADAAVGELLDTLRDTGLDATTWVVFFTDHGPAFPRAKSTLYDAGTGIAVIVRPPTGRGVAARVYDELFSGVDLVPTLLGLLGIDVPAGRRGHVARRERARPTRRRDADQGACVHDEDLPRLVRSDSSHPHQGIQLHRELRPPTAARSAADIEQSPSGLLVAPLVGGPRPEHELYDLLADPRERHNLLAGHPTDRAAAVAEDLAATLHEWRQKTGDVIPSEFAGTRIAERDNRRRTDAIR